MKTINFSYIVSFREFHLLLWAFTSHPPLPRHPYHSFYFLGSMWYISSSAVSRSSSTQVAMALFTATKVRHVSIMSFRFESCCFLNEVDTWSVGFKVSVKGAAGLNDTYDDEDPTEKGVKVGVFFTLRSNTTHPGANRLVGTTVVQNAGGVSTNVGSGEPGVILKVCFFFFLNRPTFSLMSMSAPVCGWLFFSWFDLPIAAEVVEVVTTCLLKNDTYQLWCDRVGYAFWCR